MTSTASIRTTFTSGTDILVGNLFLPAGAEAADRLPALVVTGTWTSVKEQMADRYAEAMAARGFAALSFDFAGFGESEGALRDVESPARKVADIHAAVGHLASLPQVDPDQIGAIGVCASAGYTALNAVADSRVRALVLVAPWLHDADLVEEIYGGAEGVAERIALANEARARHDADGTIDYVPAVSGDDHMAAMPFAIDFYESPARGGIPQWPNRFAVMAWTEWLTFDPIRVARRITTPSLVVHSEDAAIPAGAHRFADQLAGPVEQRWTDGDQFTFYDDPAKVAEAADAAAAHLLRFLGGSR